MLSIDALGHHHNFYLYRGKRRVADVFEGPSNDMQPNITT